MLADLQQQLNRPEGFSSYGAIVEWLQLKHGLNVKSGTVYHWVHYRLGAKLKAPRPVSSQQARQVVEAFKKTSV
ncbi:MAG: winged helix-turn-helix domain-containing protein [Chroococcidiopsis sp.]